MRKRAVVQVPAREEERTVEVRCDLCGKRAVAAGVWANLPVDEETRIWMQVGVVDRDGGGYSRTVECDICPACFEAKLVPALQALGVTFSEREEEP